MRAFSIIAARISAFDIQREEILNHLFSPLASTWFMRNYRKYRLYNIFVLQWRDSPLLTNV
jgi:hypothetical protein